MKNDNNLGHQYTQNPNFGTVYPATQYKGYAEQEASPFGTPSNLQQPIGQYQGNIPHQAQNRPENVRFHGNVQYGQQGMPNQFQNPQYQNQTNQYQNVAQNPNDPYGRLGQQTATTVQNAPQQLNQANTPQYNDRDRINDLLISEKYLTEGYNISTFEATDPQLHNLLKNILNETHKNRETLHRIMEQRGWYQTEPINQQQVSQTFSKFNEYKNQLPF